MINLTAKSLHYYPVKALGGVTTDQMDLGPRGFKNDRRWMFIDARGNFMSQRKNDQMVHWSAEVKGDDLLITDRRNPDHIYTITNCRQSKTKVTVTLWNDVFEASLIEHPLLEELTNAMQIPGARLVYLDESDHRSIDPRYAKEGEEVSFADGYPYLITNVASLKDLSQKIGVEMAMSRFRPNIVIDTGIPWSEDEWTAVTINDQPFRIPKPCARCRVITIDQETGEQRIELLVKLAELRKVNGKILFGMNGVWEGY